MRARLRPPTARLRRGLRSFDGAQDRFAPRFLGVGMCEFD
jgi:hypothetical protein